VSEVAPAKPKDGLSFIHSSLDDAGLAPAEFRIYCHVNRTAGRHGVCNQALTTIANHCGYCEDVTRAALKVLTAQRLLRRRDIKGIGTEYRLNIPEKWRKVHIPLRKKRSGKKSQPSPVKNSKPHPSKKTLGKGIPSEGILSEGSNSKSHSLERDKPTRENELMTRAVEVLGEQVMQQWGGVWRNRARENADKLERVLNAIRQDQKEGKTPRKDWGAYANDTWGRFAD
jgi:hypothetical protein